MSKNNVKLAFQQVGADVKVIGASVSQNIEAMKKLINAEQAKEIVDGVVGELSSVPGGHQTVAAALNDAFEKIAVEEKYVTDVKVISDSLKAISGQEENENAMQVIATAVATLKAVKHVTKQDVDDTVNAAIVALVDGAPENLNTLNELVTEITKEGTGLEALLNKITTLDQKVDAAVGNLEELETEDKGTLVGAINELKAKADALVDETDYLELYTTARGELSLAAQSEE